MGSGLKAQGSGVDAEDTRATGDVGRRARLELRFAYRGGRTVLAHAYAEPPFRVGRTFDDPCGGQHMIMASSAPGVFAGDSFEQTIHVESGARVRLTSQSAQQVHPSSASGPATIRSRYVIEDRASLSCIWDALIPFAGSRLDQRFEIDAAPGACLLWSDAFMAGREGRGERWQFASFAHELRLARDGRLDYLERFRIEPGTDAPLQSWQAAQACYFGTVLASETGLDSSASERRHADLGGSARVVAAVDLIAPSLLVTRLMSSDGPAFHRARALAAGQARHAVRE